MMGVFFGRWVGLIIYDKKIKNIMTESLKICRLKLTLQYILFL